MPIKFLIQQLDIIFVMKLSQNNGQLNPSQAIDELAGMTSLPRGAPTFGLNNLAVQAKTVETLRGRLFHLTQANARAETHMVIQSSQTKGLPQRDWLIRLSTDDQPRVLQGIKGDRPQLAKKSHQLLRHHRGQHAGAQEAEEDISAFLRGLRREDISSSKRLER